MAADLKIEDYNAFDRNSDNERTLFEEIYSAVFL